MELVIFILVIAWAIDSPKDHTYRMVDEAYKKKMTKGS